MSFAIAGMWGSLHAPVARTTARAVHSPLSVSTTWAEPVDSMFDTIVSCRTGASNERR